MGYLIAIDGIDASGKTTQSPILCERLREIYKGKCEVLYITFPDYTSESSSLVKMYLNGKFGKNVDDVNPYAASSFYAVDRFSSYMTNWKKFYEKENSVIVANRYTTANAIHQLPKLDKSEWNNFLDWLWDYEFNKLRIPKPDLIIFLDMHIDVAIRLIEERARINGVEKDIHEANAEYLKQCYEAAKYASEHLGWKNLICYEKDESNNALVPVTREKTSENLFNCVIENIKKHRKF